MSENQKQITKEEPTLYKRSIKGGYWVFSLRITSNLLGFIKSLIVANIFFLNDLGIISAAIMMMEVLSTFTQTGFEAALIQKKGDIRDYLDTVWTAGIVKGILLFGILYVCAPLMASFKIPEDKLETAIAGFRVMGITFLLSSLTNIGVIYFQKDLEFHKTFLLSLFSTLADIILSIILVLVFRSIWGVVAARLASSAINTAGSYLLSGYRPRLHFIPSKARELWKYGKWISGQNMLGYLLEAGDDFFVWFYLGVQPLALYRYAFQFAMTPATHISHVISQVSFPAYSKIQNDLPRLREAYLKILKMTAFFSIPMAFIIFALGPDFVKLFFPNRMHLMIPALQILAFKGLNGSLGGTWVPLLRAMGKPEKITHLLIMGLLVLGSSIYLLTKNYGISGTALATMLIGVITGPYGYFMASRVLKCSIFNIIKQCILPLVSALLMILCIVIIRACYFEQISLIGFGTLIISGSIVYIAATLILDYFFHFEIRTMIFSQMAYLNPLGR
jgi:O-antigen/teichoic acid export membrane protein